MDFNQNITYQKLKNWILIYHMFALMRKITVQVNGMKYLQVKTSTTENAHIIMKKYVRF